MTLAFCRERHHHFRSGQASLSPSRMKMDGAILTTIAIQFNILSQTLFLLNIIVSGSARTYFRNQAGLQLSLSHSRCCHYNPFQDFPSIANQKSQLGILMSQALPLKGPYFKDPGGYRKWHLQNFDQNSKTTFQYKYKCIKKNKDLLEAVPVT